MFDRLELIFLVGVVWFSAWTVGTFLLSWMRWQKGKENPGHLVAWSNGVLAVLYLFLWTDFGYYLRNDGVELPWLRIVAELFVYVLYSWMLVVSIWNDWDDGYIIVLGGTGIGGALVTLSHLAASNLKYVPWALGAGALLLTQVFTLRKARHPGRGAWLMWGLWMVWIIGVPLVQLLGWTMTEALDVSPDRNTTEILYLAVYGIGVTVYGILQIFFFEPRPSTRPLEKFVPMGIPTQEQCLDPVSVQSPIGVNIQHRASTWNGFSD